MSDSIIKDTQGKKAPSSKTPTLSKSTDIDVWMVGISNQIFIRGSLNWNKILNGNVAFLILVLWTKKRYSSFMKTVRVFQKIRNKVKV